MHVRGRYVCEWSKTHGRRAAAHARACGVGMSDRLCRCIPCMCKRASPFASRRPYLMPAGSITGQLVAQCRAVMPLMGWTPPASPRLQMLTIDACGGRLTFHPVRWHFKSFGNNLCMEISRIFSTSHEDHLKCRAAPKRQLGRFNRPRSTSCSAASRSISYTAFIADTSPKYIHLHHASSGALHHPLRRRR